MSPPEETVDPAVAQAESRAKDPSGWPWVVIGGLLLGFFILPFGGLYLWGILLPPTYEAVAVGTITVPHDTVWETLTEPEAQGDWRPGVTRAELGSPIDGDPVVVLHTGETRLTLRRAEMVPRERVAWTVVPSRKHVFEGGWTYELSPAGEGATRVRVTEVGRVQSAFARAVTHAFFGVDTYARANITALARRHAATATLEPAPGDG
jgi:uncharacterized protein YndB with AHSA1/START domain